jgi:hypothetical protein
MLAEWNPAPVEEVEVEEVAWELPVAVAGRVVVPGARVVVTPVPPVVIPVTPAPVVVSVASRRRGDVSEPSGKIP